MTLENWYKPELDATIAEYRERYAKALQRFPAVSLESADITHLLTLQSQLTSQIKDLEAVVIPSPQFDGKSLILQKFSEMEVNQNIKKAELIADFDKKCAIAKADHENKEAEAKAYNESLVEPLKAKHRKLLSYQKSLDKVFERYGITPLDMEISPDLTQEELMGMLDASIEICEEYSRPNPNLLDRYLQPLQRNKTLGAVGGYLLLTWLIGYFILPVITVIVFVYLYKAVDNMSQNSDKLKLARSLMSQIDYNRYVPGDEFLKVDDLSLEEFEEELASKQKAMEDIGTLREQALAEYSTALPGIQEQLNVVFEEVRGNYQKCLNLKKNQYKMLTSKLEKALANYKAFPKVQQTTIAMQHKYVVGRFQDTLDVTVEVPNKNIVFDNSDPDKGLNNLKLYLCNMLLSVRVKQLQIEIFDPKNLCSSFAEFFTPETSQYIKVADPQLSTVVDNARKWVQSNIMVLDNKTLDEYNIEADEKGIVPKPYRLIIFVSEMDKYLSGDGSHVFREFFKYSANQGMHLWILSRQKLAGGLFVDCNSKAMKGAPIEYTIELGKQTVQTYTESLATYKDTGIPYLASYASKYLPEDKWWTTDTISGVNLNWGLENGDPTKGYPQPLCDKQVHCLLGGETGSGKSATINQMIMSLILQYPPSELKVIYIDFKTVEAAKFAKAVDSDGRWLSEAESKAAMDRDEYLKRISKIPQVGVIAGTTDGEYALSVFEYLMDEMQERQKLLSRVGVTKIEELRKQLLTAYRNKSGNKTATWLEMRKDWDYYKPNIYDKYGDMPRILVIFDEFQVMYNPEYVPQKIIAKIDPKITAITKLGRAMGCHLWFTAQSMKGTMSKDTQDNFAFRACLKGSRDISEAIIGNPAASTITQMGYVYTNNTGGRNKDANKLWRIPYLDEKEIPALLEKLEAKLPVTNETSHRAEFYDERVLVPSSVLTNWYTHYPDTFKKSDVFVLGERAVFSKNNAPVNLVLTRDTNENIVLAGFEKKDMMNLLLTMLDNIKQSGTHLVLNCQDKNTIQTAGLESYAEPELREFLSPDFPIPDFLGVLDELVQQRLNGDPEDFPDLYVVCVQWETAPTISVDVKFPQQDKFKQLLRVGPTVGIHFILAFKDKLEMPRSIPMACSHKIGALLPTTATFFMDNCSEVEKLPAESANRGNFAIYEYGPDHKKFKIYQHDFSTQSREIVI